MEKKNESTKRLHIVVAETMGTDGEFYSEVYPCIGSEEAFYTMCSLIADMAETMDMDLTDTYTTTLEGDNWWYRVKDVVFEDNDFPNHLFN